MKSIQQDRIDKGLYNFTEEQADWESDEEGAE